MPERRRAVNGRMPCWTDHRDCPQLDELARISEAAKFMLLKGDLDELYSHLSVNKELVQHLEATVVDEHLASLVRFAAFGVKEVESTLLPLFFEGPSLEEQIPVRNSIKKMLHVTFDTLMKVMIATG